MSKKITIITINFNNLEGLKKTIESVVSQSSNEYEYIIIDGASTDGSKELIEKYSDKISYYISEPDSGIYNAMNKGILQAKSEYVQFLNSGDYLVNSSVIGQIIPELNDFAFVYGNMIKSISKNNFRKEKNVDVNSMLTHFLGGLNHPSYFIQKSLFDKYGLYDENLKIVSDWKFFLEAIALGNEKVKYCDIDVTVFDMTGISTTNSKLDKSERRSVLQKTIPKAILNDYDQYWRDIDMMKRLKRNRLAFKFVYFIERILFKFEKMSKKSK